MSWFIDGAAGTRPVHAHGEPRPWLPTSWAIDEAQGAPGSETASHRIERAPSGLRRGRDGAGRAAVRLGVERETRAACAAQPAARQADALDRLARSLRAAIAERQVEADATTRRVALLAEAIGCAAAADPPGERRRIRAVVTGMIAAVAPAPLGLRLVLDPDAADLLRPMLPEISSQTGLAGSIELTADPALPAGASTAPVVRGLAGARPRDHRRSDQRAHGPLARRRRAGDPYRQPRGNRR